MSACVAVVRFFLSFVPFFGYFFTYPEICKTPALVPSATGYVHSTPNSNAIGNMANPKNPKPAAPTAMPIPSFVNCEHCERYEKI